MIIFFSPVEEKSNLFSFKNLGKEKLRCAKKLSGPLTFSEILKSSDISLFLQQLCPLILHS